MVNSIEGNCWILNFKNVSRDQSDREKAAEELSNLLSDPSSGIIAARLLWDKVFMEITFHQLHLLNNRRQFQITTIKRDAILKICMWVAYDGFPKPKSVESFKNLLIQLCLCSELSSLNSLRLKMNMLYYAELDN